MCIRDSPNSSPDNGGEMPGDIGLNEDEVMLDEIDPFSIVSQENVSLIVWFQSSKMIFFYFWDVYNINTTYWDFSEKDYTPCWGYQNFLRADPPGFIMDLPWPP